MQAHNSHIVLAIKLAICYTSINLMKTSNIDKESITQFFARIYKDGVKEVELNKEQLKELILWRASNPLNLDLYEDTFLDIKIKNFNR